MGLSPSEKLAEKPTTGSIRAYNAKEQSLGQGGNIANPRTNTAQPRVVPNPISDAGPLLDITPYFTPLVKARAQAVAAEARHFRRLNPPNCDGSDFGTLYTGPRITFTPVDAIWRELSALAWPDTVGCERAWGESGMLWRGV